MCCETIAAEFRQNSAKGISIYCDIRDVFASYLKQQEKPFESLWNEGFVETRLITTIEKFCCTSITFDRESLDNGSKILLRIKLHRFKQR